MGNGGIGAVPSVYAIDVLPAEHRGLGIGIFRSAGDFGACMLMQTEWPLCWPACC